jgi:hypothetical protein
LDRQVNQLCGGARRAASVSQLSRVVELSGHIFVGPFRPECQMAGAFFRVVGPKGEGSMDGAPLMVLSRAINGCSEERMRKTDSPIHFHYNETGVLGLAQGDNIHLISVRLGQTGSR